MNLPNYLSALRIILVALFVCILLYYTPERAYLMDWGLGVLVVACLTDAADGYLARKLKQQTQLGSYIDPIADKLLLISGFLSLSFMPHLPPAVKIPAWVTIPVITRDIMILLGSLMIFLMTGRLKVQPLIIGKITTAFQMGTLVISLMNVPLRLKFIFACLTVVLTLISGVGYLRMGGRLFQKS